MNCIRRLKPWAERRRFQRSFVVVALLATLVGGVLLGLAARWDAPWMFIGFVPVTFGAVIAIPIETKKQLTKERALDVLILISAWWIAFIIGPFVVLKLWRDAGGVAGFAISIFVLLVSVRGRARAN